MSTIKPPHLLDHAESHSTRTNSDIADTKSPSSVLANDQINILLVDDEARNLTVLETVLDDPSYRLVCAESADQALIALVAEEFAVLVLDIQMPGMNGFELAQLIKQRRKTANVPIIFLTAYYSEDQHILEGYNTGAVDYLHKPINPTILKSKVAVFAELYRKTRESELANRALLAEVTERRRAQETLRQLTDELEQRVIDRTADLVQAQAAMKEADRSKDEFLATLAHELRNPLAPIRNAVEVLKLKGFEQPELNWASNIIDRQTLHLTRLVDDLLDVSRITMGKLELRKEQVELENIIQGAVEMSRHLIELNSHALNVSLPNQSVTLYADTTRVSQVIANLLNNAAKYTEPGGSIELKAQYQRDEVIVSVKDTGMGIPAEMLPHVFQMFTQVDRQLERSQDGLGIGLTLVKRLVELHGGTVEAYSAGAGAGSEFVFRLPVGSDNASFSSERDMGSNANTTPQLRILIVDDNKDSAQSLGMILQMKGNEVHTAYDGLAAIEAAEDFRPDVALLDIGMPNLNGYDACRRIREQKWGRQIVMIAQTGWGQTEDRKNTLAAGFDYHLVKPIDIKILMEILSNSTAKQ